MIKHAQDFLTKYFFFHFGEKGCHREQLMDYVEKFPAKPLDVTVVAGYNDLVKGHTRDFILEKLYNLADLVLDAESGLDKNTIAIATLMYPPQLAWFSHNGRIPYPEYVNQKEKIDWINQEIKILNVRNDAFVYPGFHTYGVRKLTRNHFDRNGKLHEIPAKSHRWEHWREAEPGRMLHLRNDRRFKMGTALTNYFTFNTSTCNNSDSWLCWWEGRNDRSRG